MKLIEGVIGVTERTLRKVSRPDPGQTMTEYALILAAIAVVVFAIYEVMGQDIGSLVSKVNTALTAT